ncbi:hypothetical protein FXO38_28103 [Capsicum annuum]|nr:hypothetical protein FXO38_28103 [Capsicum annuum]
MSKSPSSSHRMTQSQSQRLLGACKDEEKDLSKGKEKKKHKVSDQLTKPNYSLSNLECGGFPLAFQCWFYEYCSYADDKLVVQVGDSAPRVLNWSVTIRPNYRKVKFAFSDINREQYAEYHSGHNVGLKNDNTHAGNPIEVNLPDNLGRQTDGTPKVDHVSDNVVDGVGQKNIGVKDCIDVEAGNKRSANLIDDVEKKNIDVGDHIDVVAGDHLSDNVVDNIGKKTVGDSAQGSSLSRTDPCHVSRYPNSSYDSIEFSQSCDSGKPHDLSQLSDISNISSVNGIQLRDTSSSPAVAIAFQSQRHSDKSTVILDDTPIVPRRIKKPAAICESPYVSKFDSGCSNVQGQPTKCIDKGHSRKHIFSIKHPFTISITEPFLDMKLLSSFNKFVDKPLRLNSNPVYSKSVNNLANVFDFGVVTIKIKEWFYMLRYAGVPLTDSFLGKRKDVVVIKEDSEITEFILGYVMRRVAEKAVSAYSELIPNLLSSIDFGDKRSDGIAVSDLFDIRMVDGFPTQKNTHYGVFVAAFAEYMIEGVQIPASLDDINSIDSRYGVLLWQYGKIKQKQHAINDDESTGRLKKKN